MATKVNINGKLTSLPGVYAITKSGIVNPPTNLSYGNIVIIDDGIGAGFGAGTGVLGTAKQGGDSIYEFSSLQAMRDFVKGGELWNLALPLFKPARSSAEPINGVSKVFLIHARETSPATISLDLANGSLDIETQDEGLNANGVLATGKLARGYAAKLSAGVADKTKFVLSLYHGAFKGTDPLNNAPYDGIAAADTRAAQLVSSPEVATITELVAWMNASTAFKTGFRLKNSAVTTTGAIVAADLVTYPDYVLATGATETYTPAAFDAALSALNTQDFTFFFSTRYAAEVKHANNQKLLDFITGGESKYERFMVAAAQADKAGFNTGEDSSIAAAHYYNSDKVILVHGAAKLTTQSGFKLVSQLYKAAAVLGRIAGLAPQTPATFKRIGINGEVHKLDNAELELANNNGLLVTHYDYELDDFVILQGINTLQQNEYLVNEDGTSPSIAVKRITAQLNKEIVVNAKRKFFGKDNAGPNRNTVTEADLKAWLEGFLQSRTANALTDNLIIRFGNVSATVSGDNYYVQYEFVPNFEVNKIVITGVILEA
ncbi:hypothetical protein SAMN05444266_102221 [Chitinophaga jiangningensis]|uniref:Phage tail sheath protein n=1 Tax=Chitinophaga jiangningensis TaxID=1419482 RepID=A0A1M6YA95_9BACT|nr:hypothetical protein [Chitinophaga jiangningensis]SHL15083.1 hypothetical protein SAMN05444266_102221 [Chitinophaga jiangningensis]